MKNLKHMSFVTLLFITHFAVAQGFNNHQNGLETKKETTKTYHVSDVEILKLKKLAIKISKIEKNKNSKFYVPQHKIDFLKEKAEEVREKER